ncbi:DoxX family protein [Streptomyces shenzhenensis]|uniref:DoxX family protein n=1 Tax=Streptomyces shenzhenensis TaxID=943815 RepID=UPI001604C81D|nr:DoxX family protein [Streptomyces shenzhenensis]
MSVDTRTPRTPTGDRSSGFDDAPALSMVKVPSDPAQVIVNHASFRVQLGASTWRTHAPLFAGQSGAARDTAGISVGGTAGGAGPARTRRRPVVWSGRSAPDDTGAHRLLQAVRGGSVRYVEEPSLDTGATQVIPRIDADYGNHTGYTDYADYTDDTGYGGYDDFDRTVETPVIGSQRTPGSGETRLLPHMRTVGSAYDEPGYADEEFDDYAEPARADDEPSGKRHGDDPARHAYYPGRRMNLGVVLLPLRIFLGFISVYAGMGKLCDPVYFDGGKRGSMVKWLNTLHPWDVAEPLRQFALQHPVGSGLVIAFLQVVVGVLTILGCWQRVAAVVGAGLSAALIVTVSWKTVPAYDAPDIIYLAAWSPLIIAGAPVYSIDGRLAGRAWRTLGPRSDIWELRRYVLRRGALVTAVTVGLTLLVGSLLGGAVRDSSRVVVPGPGEAPRNNVPGSPLPDEPSRKHSTSPSASSTPSGGATAGADPSGSGAATTPGAARSSGTVTGGAPSQTQGTVGQAPPQRNSPAGQAPSTSAGPSSGGTATGGSGDSGGSGGSPAGTSGTGGGSEDGGSSTSGQPGRLVGGLLG